jgi:hypothetical protein
VTQQRQVTDLKQTPGEHKLFTLPVNYNRLSLKLEFLLDEGVGERLVDGAPLARVQHQNLVQQVPQLIHLFGLVLRQTLVVDQLSGEISGWLNGRHYDRLLPFGDAVNLVRKEVAVSVKVLLFECSFPDQLVGELALQVHAVLQHLVVGATREHDFSSVQLVDGAAGRPHVDTVVVGNAQD